MRWLEPQCARHTRSVEVAGLARRGRAFTCSGAPSQPTKAAVDPIKEALQVLPGRRRVGRAPRGRRRCRLVVDDEATLTELRPGRCATRAEKRAAPGTARPRSPTLACWPIRPRACLPMA